MSVALSSTRFPLRLGTRASPLAVAQADMVKAALLAKYGWAEDAIKLVPMTASGDKIQDRALADVGGKALWTKELDAELAGGRIDFSVHSMKDVETIRPAAFVIAAMLPRADVRDRLIGAARVADLPQGATVGTASPRRTAQLLRMRPDLHIILFRGNVATRLTKLEAGQADATLLAAAGLDRLGMDDVGHAIAVDEMLPAPQQGAIGIECRADDEEVREALSGINHAATCAAVEAERALLAELGGDCQSPVAALAVVEKGGPRENGFIRLSAQLLSSDGSEAVEGSILLDASKGATPEKLARDLLGKAPPAVRALFAGAVAGAVDGAVNKSAGKA